MKEKKSVVASVDVRMVKYRKAFRSSIRDALSAEKVRERERKKLWNSSRHPIVSEKAINQSKSLTKVMERESLEKKRNQTTTYHSLLSQSLLVRLPHFLALGANRIRVGRAMLHVFCLFFLSPKRCLKQPKSNEEKRRKMMDG